MTSNDYDNNQILIVSASIVGGMGLLMALTLLFLIMRRKRMQEAEPKSDLSKNNDPIFDPTIAVADQQGVQRQGVKATMEDNPIAKSLGNKILDNQNEDVDEVPDSFASTAGMMGSSCQSGQYHFSLREGEFPDVVRFQQDNGCVVNRDNYGYAEAEIPEEKLTGIVEECSDSDYDATFETTVPDA